MSLLQRVLRGIDGASLAAVRVLLRRGPREAQRVVATTLRAARDDRVHRVTAWFLARAFASNERVVVDAGDWTDGSLAPLERFLLALLVRFFRPRRIVEIGTYRGTSTKLLLDNAPAEARVFTIDLPPERGAREVEFLSDERLIHHRDIGVELSGHPRASEVTQIFGDSLTDATWTQVPEAIDFALVDASHTYEAVRNDSERVYRKLAPEGVIVWHDYTEGESPERGVGRYLRELMDERDDVFVCAGTSVGLRIPERSLLEGEERARRCFPARDYAERHPSGGAPWLRRR